MNVKYITYISCNLLKYMLLHKMLKIKVLKMLKYNYIPVYSSADNLKRINLKNLSSNLFLRI